MACLGIVPIFGDLTTSEMAEIAAITHEGSKEKGEVIYRAGTMDKRLYVIHAGRVKISRLSPTGREQVLRIVGPGDFLGELTILNDAPLLDYAEATEPCTMCMIEGSRLKELMTKYPSISMKIMSTMSERLARAEGLIEDISLHSPELRLAQAILELAGDRNEVELTISKGDFASQLGMTQETLSRKLTFFKEQGLLELKGRRGIKITDRSALARFDS